DSRTGLANVVIDTPGRSRCKYKYEPATRQFHLRKLLPAGAVFPYPFGFIPATVTEDGDPLDVLVIVDEPLFAGCVLPVRLIGILEAEQRETSGDVVRNDRLIGVIETEYNPPPMHALADLDRQVRKEIEHFFASYNQFEGREIHWLKQAGPQEALRHVEKGTRRFAEQARK
ncbi:MAG TPA: inorganic diphosphatase, partial [Planctomycetaceae bacterium]